MALVTMAIACLVHPAAAQAAPPKKIAASLERIFGKGAQVDSVTPDTIVVFRVRKAGALLGYATVENVLGKDQPITYLVAVDSTLQLLDVDILVYREPYGGEVAYESWRRQFHGKKPGDGLQVGHEIRGISGATISVNSVTAGIRRTLSAFATWRASGAL